MIQHQWMPLPQAVRALNAAFPDEKVATAEILNRVISEMIEATCERLVRTGPSGKTYTDWPDTGFGLAAMLGRVASYSARTRPDISWPQGFMSWSDADDSATSYQLFGLHVARERIMELAGRFGAAPLPSSNKVDAAPSGARRLSPSTGKSVPVVRASVSEVADWIAANYTRETLPHVTKVLFPAVVAEFHGRKNRKVIRRTVEEAVARLGWSRAQGRQ